MPDLHRALVVLLEEYAPLCERCLASHARRTISDVAETLAIFRRSIALRVEHAQCPGCQEFTQTFALAKTREGG